MGEEPSEKYLDLLYYRDDWPQSVYMNSMDVWQIMSYLNVFFVLVEYCLVLWMSKADPLEDVIINKVSPRVQAKKNVCLKVKLFFTFKMFFNDIFELF